MDRGVQMVGTELNRARAKRRKKKKRIERRHVFAIRFREFFLVNFFARALLSKRLEQTTC